jgi:transposase InsO family protein
MLPFLQLFLSFVVRGNPLMELVAENLALKQQLAVMKRKGKRPRLRARDRLFWLLLAGLWPRWKESLLLVRPETVIHWHRQGFKLFWRYKSRRNRNTGRPMIDPAIRALVRRMARENPSWGAPRIHGELLKLGFEVSERTVSDLMPKRPDRPGQTWKIFLRNHLASTCSMDFFTVPTINFRILYVLLILSHDRRRIVHFNITRNPTAAWTMQQVREAFPWNTTPKYLIRDRDSIYGNIFRQGVADMGIEQIVTAYKSPWQNGYVERMVGSIRRDCLDRHIILGEKHLQKVLTEYLDYYHEDRTHCGLGKDSPVHRDVQRKPASGKIVSLPRCGGLHHRYEWKEAA